MAKGDGSDIFMMFHGPDGKLDGESQSVLQIPGRPTNALYKGFEPGKIFEITKFNLGLGTDQGGDPTTQMLKGIAKANPDMKIPKFQPEPKPAADPTAANRQDTAVSVQPVSFTRQMDNGSSQFLSNVIKRSYFKHVALVKRKAAGGLASGEPYLRMDFKGVILIEVSWSNDDPIEETYSFHARGITIRYCPQLPDGSLGAAISGFWSMAPGERETT